MDLSTGRLGCAGSVTTVGQGPPSGLPEGSCLGGIQEVELVRMPGGRQSDGELVDV